MFRPEAQLNNWKIHKDVMKNWTNCHHGCIAASLDLTNSKMTRQTVHDFWTLVEPNGIKHLYKGEKYARKLARHDFEQLDVETTRIFPSGITYEYDHEGILNLKRIRSFNRHKQLIADIKSRDVHASSVFELHASTGDWVRYSMTGQIYKVESSQQPTVEYKYSHFFMDQMFCYPILSKISKPDGRYRRVIYLDGGELSLQKEYEKNTGYYEKNRMKVKAYYGPGADDQEVALYEFEYKDDYTIVKDALGQKTFYYFDKNKRLKHVVGYDVHGNGVYTKETRWANEPNEGRLEAYWVKDKEGIIPTFKRCEYDVHGNVIKEKTWTKLKSQDSYPLVDDNAQLKNVDEVEAYEVLSSYTQDEFHLLTETIHPSGKRDQYLYEPDSNRKSAHFVWWNGNLCERHLWTYDAFSEIASEIHDDGSSPDPDSLEGVQKRVIKRFIRHNQDPHMGLVEYEQTSYLDLNTMQEVPLHRIDYTYSVKRRVNSLKVTDLVTGQVRESDYDYDEKGCCIGETTFNGIRIARYYDANKNLVCQTGPGAQVELRFAYDKNDRLKEKKVIYPDGTWVETYSYDHLGHMISKTDPHGIREAFIYDMQGRIVEKKTHGLLASDLTISQDPLVERMSYDILGNLIEHIDARGYSRKYEYNGIGFLFFEKHPDGTTVQYIYNNTGCLEKKIHNDLWSEEFTYDEENHLIQIDRVEGENREIIQKNTYNRSLLIERIDALGHKDTYEYDGAGRPILHERKDATSGVVSCEEWTYDGFGVILGHRKWQNETDYIEEISRYDASGLIAEKFHRNQLGEVQGHEIYIRNETGLIIETQHLDHEDLTHEYFERDTHGQLVRHIDQIGQVTVYRRHYLTPGIAGVLGTLIEEVRPTQDLSWTWEDSLNRPVEIKLFDANEKLIQYKHLGYDAASHLVFRLEECLAEGVSTSSPILTKLVYGVDNLVLKRFDAAGSDQERYREWVYDEYGRCIAKHEPSISHFYTYDRLGRIVRSWTDDGTVDYIYDYDSMDHPLMVMSMLTLRKTLRSYDAWNRVTEETLETGDCYKRIYDGLGQVTQEIYSDGSKVVREYVGAHLRSTERQGAFTYRHTVESYDSQGRPLTETMAFIDPTQATINRSYDRMGRVLSLNRPGYRANQIHYDARGRLISRTITENDVPRVETYDYDALDQLEKEQGLVNHTYLHDSRQRRLAKDDTRTLVDSLDQIESMSDDTSEFTYDLDGRLVSYLKEGELCQMSYDAWSRLITFKRGDLEVNYVYDAYDRCMRRNKKQGGTEQLHQYGYIDRRLVAIESEGHFQHRIFVRGDSTEQGDTLAWEIEGQVRLPILDLGGSTIGWMDRSGSILARWSFDSFGMPLQEVLGPWGYCSKFHDTSTDLVYFSKRYYIPSWGRWLTRDPKGEIDGSNLYAYVGNNPLTRVDSWGLMTDFDRGSCSDRTFSFYEPGDSGIGWRIDYEGLLLSEARQTLFDQAPNYTKSGNVYIVHSPCPETTAENNKTALITGAANSLGQALRNAHILASLLGTDVILGYIPTKGTIADLTDGLLERNGIKDIPVEHAKIVWEVIEKGIENVATLSLFAHSRGNHAVRAADVEYGKNNYDTFQQVHVYGVAGSGMILPGHSFGSISNAVCTRDFAIRLFDNGAIERQRESGILIEIQPYGGNDRGPLTFSEHTFDCPSSQTAIETHQIKKSASSMNYISIIFLALFLCFGDLRAAEQDLALTSINLQRDIERQLPKKFAEYINVNLQYKCWAYEADISFNSDNGWNQKELCSAAIRGMQALYHSLQKSQIKDRLYYDPSNLYLYSLFITELRSHLMLYVKNGIFRLVKHQKYLTSEEREKYKDQLSTQPKVYNGNHHIVIWEKSFEEILKETGKECKKITRDPELVLNFSEDSVIREAIIKVRTRVLEAMKAEGYNNYVSVPFAKLAIRNKEGPYHWMFFIRKSFPDVKDRKETPIPYDPEAYEREYKRLHQLILSMINDAPELKPYLKHPVIPRDLEFNFTWEQQFWDDGNYCEAYDHLIYRTHSRLIMQRDLYDLGISSKSHRELNLPLEEFFQKIGI